MTVFDDACVFTRRVVCNRRDRVVTKFRRETLDEDFSAEFSCERDRFAHEAIEVECKREKLVETLMPSGGSPRMREK